MATERLFTESDIQHEMPDKKYYPLSKYGWTKKGLVEIPANTFLHLLNALSESVSVVQKKKHEFRQSGVNSLEAYRSTQLLMPLLIGFHKSAIVDSGFGLVAKRVWKVGV